MYSFRFAGSGIARNFVSQSRSAWLERGEEPTRGVSSAASDNEGTMRLKIKSTAAKRRMRFLSGFRRGNYNVRRIEAGLCVTFFSTNSAAVLRVLRGQKVLIAEAAENARRVRGERPVHSICDATLRHR